MNDSSEELDELLKLSKEQCGDELWKELLKKKFERIKRKKFEESFVVHCGCDHIKSAGNGL